MVSSTRFSASAEYHLRHRAAERSFRLQAEAILSRLSPTDMPVLDLGCGTAPLWPFLDRLGLQGVGADYDLAMLQGATRRAGPRFALAAAEHLPFKDESFGAVTSLGLFEYLRAPLVVLRELRRVLRPGGRLHITVPYARARYRRALGVVNPLVSRLRGNDPFDLAAGSPPDVPDASMWASSCRFVLERPDFIVPQVLPWPLDRYLPRLATALGDRASAAWATILLLTLVKVDRAA